MTRAMAIFQVNDEDDFHVVAAGELIGRSDLAALCLDDPRISEAHAMVSLRGQGLKLLALRGRFRVDGEGVADVLLTPGLRIELAPELFVSCLEVNLPPNILAVEFGGLPRLTPSGTTTLYALPNQRIKHGYDPKGDAILWPVGTQWRLLLVERGETLTLEGDTQVDLHGTSLKTSRLPLHESAFARTQTSARRSSRIEAHRDFVKVWRGEDPEDRPVLITGIPGKICSVLVAQRGVVHWRDVIDHVWPDDASLERALRKRFDSGLSRLRERFDQLGLDPNTLRLDGAGMLMLSKIETSEPLPTTSPRGQDGSP